MDWLNNLLQEIPPVIKLISATVIGVIFLYFLFQYFLKKIIIKIKKLVSKITIPVELLSLPVRFLFPAICLAIILPFLHLEEYYNEIIKHFLAIWFITGFAWLIMRILTILKINILSRYNLETKDNLKARQISTQLNVIQRVISVIIFIIAVSAVLMTFDEVRQVGVSILASAGIAGIIIGFAAQRSLATLIAGIQIAITQPVRIDDVVIIENEWGRIEEITLTYVVVSIWDQRRLIVPITYLLEQPFQNWTRKTAELLGTVFIYTDYSVAVDEIRSELESIVKNSPLWDERLVKLQVTNATEKTMELRALVSAEDSSKTWELRCLVREKLIDFMQRKYPDKLPRIRLESIPENPIHKIS
jgi:small-conductance mechanosensitive channel